MTDHLPFLKIIIRGAGEMATGTACRLHRSGFTRILMTEIDKPMAVRRAVSFCEAVHEGSWTVEGIEASRISVPEEAPRLWDERVIPVIVDPTNESRQSLKPDVTVDAILAKENLGTTINDANLVIGLGPGFVAGSDVHYVVETSRGHDLARLIVEGEAAPNTGVPGDIGGHTIKRVIRAPARGLFKSDLAIGTPVGEGQILGRVDGQEVRAALRGVLRGLIRPGILVEKDLKIGDVDPRGIVSNCFTISEKARAIGGTVLEAIMMRYNVLC